MICAKNECPVIEFIDELLELQIKLNLVSIIDRHSLHPKSIGFILIFSVDKQIKYCIQSEDMTSLSDSVRNNIINKKFSSFTLISVQINDQSMSGALQSRHI